jgi:hypothetical protein
LGTSPYARETTLLPRNTSGCPSPSKSPTATQEAFSKICGSASRALEIAAPVIQVEPWKQRVLLAPKLVAAADNKQVDKAIAVGIEEFRADILGETVRVDRGLIGRPETAIGLLHENLAPLPLRTANIKIVESIAIHIADCQSRTLGRHDVRDEGLTAEIIERVVGVLEIDA